MSVPAEILDLSTVIVGTKPVESINHAAIVESMVKETEPRAVRHSILKETGLILPQVPRYSEYLSPTCCQGLRHNTTVKEPAYAACVRALIIFAYFFPSDTSTTAMIHKSATRLLRGNRVVSG